MKIVYAVDYIEVEFGQRDEGTKLYTDLTRCIDETRKCSNSGNYSDGSGYFGPVRPLCYYEVPFDSLEPRYQDALNSNGFAWTDNNWRPKFRGIILQIKG